MLLFIFIFSSLMFLSIFLLEYHKTPHDHILIRCGRELMEVPRIVKAVDYVTPFATKIRMNPLKFLAISAYLSVFLLCLLISAL